MLQKSKLVAASRNNYAPAQTEQLSALAVQAPAKKHLQYGPAACVDPARGQLRQK